MNSVVPVVKHLFFALIAIFVLLVLYFE